MEFKTYKESRLKDLGELVKDVVKDWPQDPWYPSMEQLKQTYESNENFTPETRHFLYDGDKLVAFLSSALEEKDEDGVQWGSIHMPFIRKGYEGVESKLFDKTIGLLKEKGAQKIRAFSRPEYGYIPELFEKWGFDKSEAGGKRAIFKAKDFVPKDYTEPDYFKELDLNKDEDLERFKEVYLKARKEVKKEDFDNTMNTFREQDLTISCVLVEKDKVLSYGLLYKSGQPKRSFLSSIPIFDEEKPEVIKKVLTYMANKAVEKGYEEIYHGLVDEEREELYNKMGIEFTSSFRYELKLD